ncbi:probable DOA4-independent degradation protein 4 [Saccharomycodes ludwigii]|uniref:Probable DOA4-independent degradation protein 4 n=1 Tax=Saccharomycodes ludwigii TaxID=36035 RepID=A0A376BDC5_9ASCO|nr:probable DOA4-independent degradation protein 4 [Saccharomycodes ludwigii]
MALLDWIFGKQVTPQERLRKNQRALDRTQRELEREKIKLQNQEKKLTSDIKKSAKLGQINAAKIQARDLVRTKKYIDKFDMMQTRLQAITLRIQAVRSTDQMASSMREATGLLSLMNRSLNLPQLQRITMEFEKQNDIMDQRQEMIDESIDDVMDADELDEEEEEADEIVNKVLDEIGVDLNTKLTTAPQDTLEPASSSAVNEKALQPLSASGNTAPTTNVDDDLQARLDSLKR